MKTKSREKHNGKIQGSEPDLFISMANRIPDWATVVGLIGSGQEIHDGEESGLQQWIDAVVNTGTGAMWDVHAPPGIVEQLNFREYKLIRSHY